MVCKTKNQHSLNNSQTNHFAAHPTAGSPQIDIRTGDPSAGSTAAAWSHTAEGIGMACVKGVGAELAGEGS